MYIKSIELDGFKSYGQRTVLTDFDPSFNAITGLNGSGKSNILDSICFLLGLTNLKQVRATSLRELVYKSGQAGIHRATVSITFDNTDKEASPFGYKDNDTITVSRQVLIGGRNKFLINGCTVPNNRVHDLFSSVQLNINNPHFLIMQGRITKVLSMKPPEILSMLEEAAGTSLYEAKRLTAQGIIVKKDLKLQDIDQILKEDINPRLQRLKQERLAFLEFQNVTRELEHLQKIRIAQEFMFAEKAHKHFDSELLKAQETRDSLDKQLTEGNENVKKLTEDIEKLVKQKEQVCGSALEKLRANLKEKEMVALKANSDINHTKGMLSSEVKKQKELTKETDVDKTTLKENDEQMEKLQSELKLLEKERMDDQKVHEAAQKQFQAVSAGLCSNAEGENVSLNDQLMTARKSISKAQTEAKQAQMMLKNVQQNIKKKESELKKTEKDYEKDKSAQEPLEKNIEKLQAEIEKLDYDEGKEEKLKQEKKKLTTEVRQLRGKLDQMEARYPQLQFEYKNPEKNFDRSKVHGLVCKLIKVKQPETVLALEVAAGSKLYNVVVDTEITGKQLLQKGDLQRRYTFIPLNKIIGRPINPQTVNHAESLVGKENVVTAMSLIDYEKDLTPAMEFVFGNCFVCKDIQTAKKVAFDENVLTKCVTLDGDSCDPAGTITGGSGAQTSSLLEKLQEFVEVEQRLDSKQQELKQVEEELASLRTVFNKYQPLKDQYDLKVHEASLVKSRLEKTTHHQQLEEVKELKQAIEEQMEVISRAEKTQKKAEDEEKELLYKLENFKAIREAELKKSEERVSQAKKKLDSSTKMTKEKQQMMERLRLEKEQLVKDISSGEQEIRAVEEAIKAFEEKIAEFQEASSEAQTAEKEARAELDKQTGFLKSCEKEIEDKTNEKKALWKQVRSGELKIHEIQGQLDKLKHQASAKVQNFQKENDWINEEKKYFDLPGSIYDAKENDPEKVACRVQEMQATKDKLSRTVNLRAMNMLEKVEEQYADLINRRKIILSDKIKISSVIDELDCKKNNTLEEAWLRVNKDFDAIFKSLLPGTQAKLSPIEGKTILDGLEVKVAFGDVWKESLYELSGGQRSLVALSLILSMLLFHPAPIYILDEVDAALDPSHTQNVGNMIKAHFKNSQFIVVSLKDGMFSNANVLFKTKFIDGVSTVTRHVQRRRLSSNYLPALVSQDEPSKEKKKPA